MPTVCGGKKGNENEGVGRKRRAIGGERGFGCEGESASRKENKSGTGEGGESPGSSPNGRTICTNGGRRRSEESMGVVDRIEKTSCPSRKREIAEERTYEMWGVTLTDWKATEQR